MKKFFKFIGILFLLFLLVAAGFSIKMFFIDEKLAYNKFGEEAQVLEDDGHRFRDLNKNGQLDVYEDARQPVERRIDDLISQMSLEEKAGLMFQPPMTFDENGEVLTGMNFDMGYGTYDVVGKRLINHFNIFGSSPIPKMAQWHNEMQKLAERTRLGIPITFSTDPRHSQRDDKRATSVRTQGFSLWPEPIGFGAIGDEATAYEFGRIANEEYRSIGIRMALHPMADLSTEPRWGRTVGTFGEDADLAGRLVAAYIRGFQGEQIDSNSVLTMTKHFPGGGPQDDGYDPHQFYGAHQSYPGDNFEYHLKPFENAFAAGTAQIMPYYGIPDGQTSEDVAMAFNKDIITGLLRERYGFEGVVCTDWGILVGHSTMGYVIMRARAWGVENLSILNRFKKALDAGVDQFGGETATEYVVELVEEGLVSEGRINRSVRRILKDKFRIGLFDDPYVDVENATNIAGREDFVRAGRIAQRRSIVLLKNDTDHSNGGLPIAHGSRIYVEGIEEQSAAVYGEVVSDLGEADFAIIRLKAPFAPPRTDLPFGENIIETILHQGDLDFKGEELAHIQEIMRTKPTIVVIYAERPVVIPEIAEQSLGLIAEFGAEDEAILDVVFGDFNPGGKLPFEMPSSMEAVRKQFEDVPYDSEDPLFEFGHGLSYDQ